MNNDRPPAPRWPRRWPVAVISLPAAVATWSGWVGLGEMTGFGKVKLLPGIWDSLEINTAITLPIGVEAYAAFALRAALTGAQVTKGTRKFAGISAFCALLLGMGGQIAYHLLKIAGVTSAPWQITTAVSCLPVLVLGLGAVLAHLLHRDRTAAASAVAVPETAADVSDLVVPQPVAAIPQQAPIPDTSDSVSGLSDDTAVEAPDDAPAGANLGHSERGLSDVSDAGQPKVHSLDHAIRAAKADGMSVREIGAAFDIKKWRVEKALYADSRSDTSDSPAEVSEIPAPAPPENARPEIAMHTSNGHVLALASGDWS